MMRIVILGYFLAHNLFAALAPTPIARLSRGQFHSSGFIEGGTHRAASLLDIRHFHHKSQGFERVVLDLSEPSKNSVADYLPAFQLRYFPSSTQIDDKNTSHTKPAKFLLVIRSIQRNQITEKMTQTLTKDSQFLDQIKVYPPIEDGDMALEFILKSDVLFEAHQPRLKAGRLVLDLKKAVAIH